jgi:sodium transport system permease protein
MNLRRFRILLRKEICYIERDWRTILVLFGFPIVVMPLAVLLGGFLGQIGASAQAEPGSSGHASARVATSRIPAGSPLFADLRKQRRLRLIESKWPIADLENGNCELVIDAPTNAAAILKERGSLRVRVLYDQDANIPWGAVQTALNDYANDELRARLGNFSLSAEYLQPVRISYSQITTEARVRARLERQSKSVIPLVGLIMIILVCAGCLSNYTFFLLEREEGTLETLVSNPVRPWEILAAKWSAMLVFTILQMAVYAIIMASLGELYGLLRVSRYLPTPVTFEQTLYLVACLFQSTMFFYALLAVACSIAQSAREANSMTGMLSFLLIGLTAIPLAPGGSSNIFAILPASNLSFAIRQTLSGFPSPRLWEAALLSNLVYTGVLLWLAGRLVGREESILGGMSALRLTLVRARLKPRPSPSVQEALLFAALMLAIFVFGAIPLQLRHLESGLVATQLGVFLILPAALAAYLKIDLRETFRLRLPSPGAALSAAMIAAGWLLLAPGLILLQNKLLPVPAGYLAQAEEFLRALSGRHSVAALLFGGALLPAICEEFAFRGFILSGFASRWPLRGAATATALLFATAHLDPYRFGATFVLGFLSSVLAVRSRSILPSILLHALNNGTVIALAAYWGRQAPPAAGERPVGLPAGILAAMACAGILVLARALRSLPNPALPKNS